MIRATILKDDNRRSCNDMTLIDEWKQSQQGILWVDIEGEVGEEEAQILRDLNCHELSINDVKRKRHPPKLEHFELNTFVLFRGIESFDDDLTLLPQQIGFFISEQCLITVHRGQSVSINEFWGKDGSGLQESCATILALRIMHYSAGRYLEVLLDFEDELTSQEDKILGESSETAMKELVSYRSRLLKLRRIMSYHDKLSVEIMQWLDADNLHEDIKHTARDLYDRCERLFSLTSMFYDTCGDLIDGYISITSHKLNNTMRILTVITAIFIPLGFIAGLYGMNFAYMPELQMHNGYFILLTVMASIALTLIVIFKKKRWL